VRGRLRRFAVIAILVTCLDFGLLVVLRLAVGLPVIVADAISIALAACASYGLHRAISFAQDPQLRWVREPGTFAWATLVAGVVDVAVIRGMVALVGSTRVAPLAVAKSVSLVVAGIVRWISYRERLFKTVRREQAERTGHSSAPGNVRLSVIVPAYRCGPAIIETVARLRTALADVEANGGLEVVIVDDGSHDGTAAEACIAGADQVLALPENRGKGAAVRAGMLVARGRTVAFTDADLSYPPEQILGLLAEAENGWDMVVGSRKHIGTFTLAKSGRMREVAGRMFNLASRALLLGQYRDTQCGLKAFRSDAARLLFCQSRIEGFAFDVELFHLAERYHLSLLEVPVALANAEASTVRLALDASRMLRDLFRVTVWAGRGVYDLTSDGQRLLF